MIRKHKFVMLTAFVTVFLLLVYSNAITFAATSVFINEIHYDNASGDVGEAIEVAGVAGTDLSSWSLVLYNGSNGSVYGTTALSGVIPDQENGFGTIFVSYPANGLQNGPPDGVALVNDAGAVEQFLSYEGTFIAVGGPADGMTSTDIGVAEGSGTAVGNSLQLTGTGSMYEDFTWASPAANTFGAPNTGQTFTGGSSGPNAPLINEFVFNHTGTDTEAFIEVLGDADTDYSAYTVLEIEGDAGNTGIIDAVLTIGTTDANGYWVNNEDVENGTASLLLVEAFTGSLGDDIDADDDGVIDNAAWTAVIDSIAVTDMDTGDFTYGDTTLLEGYDGNSFTVGGASRIPNGTDTNDASDWVRNDYDGEGFTGFTGTPEFGEAINTPGAANEAVPQPTPTGLLINEIDYDQPSTDASEFIEILNNGSVTVSLDGITLLLINGNSDSVYNTINLPNVQLAAGDYFVVCGDSANVANCDLDITPDTNLIQNGAPDAVALTLGEVIFDAVSYEGSVHIPYVEGSGDGLVDDSSLDFASISRYPNGIDSNQNNLDLSQRCMTPGTANTDAATNCTAPQIGSLVINEIDYDQDGTDAAEFVEIYNASNAIINLSTYELQFVNGNGAAIYVTTTLPDLELNPGQFFVVCGDAANVANCDLDISPDTNLIQNGSPDAVALVENSVVIDTVSYEGSVAAPYTEGSGSGLEDWAGDGYSGISRFPDGIDTNQNNVDLAQHCATPGEANTDTATECTPPVIEVCGDPFTFVYDIQGNGPASALDGTVVSTEGVVTATFYDTDEIGGFFLQDPSGDGDHTTSDGIYVFTTFYSPAVGESVRVRGEVNEFYDLTEITNVEIVLECGAAAPVAPTQVWLPIPEGLDAESYEGMLLTFPQPLVISEYFNYDRYGEIVVAPERLHQPTAVFAPGSPEAEALVELYARSRMTIDDGRTSSNPDPAIHPNGLEFTLDNTFRGGDTLENVTGVLYYTFGSYILQPTQGADHTAANPRTAAPDVGGNITVASFNVLNYFTTLDGNGSICGPESNQGCRGADNQEEFDRQRAKIIAALAEIDADVVGLIEIENHPTDAAIADLVAGLNDVVGAGTYDYVATGPIGDDVIRVAFIYKPATVTAVGDFAVLDDVSFTDPLNTGQGRNRPALAQTFADNSNGGTVTVVVNHFKSKSGSELDDTNPDAICVDSDPSNDVPDCDQGDGQGYFNATRTATAQALADWLATDPTGSGDADVLIIGDLNAYDKEDPITVLTSNSYTDLMKAFGGEFAYSYVFDGQVGYLDYALANDGLSSQVSGVAAWHINADEPDILDYDTSFKKDAQDALYEPNAYRASDHDPVIVGLDLTTPPPTNADGCYVLAIDGSPFDGLATTVEKHRRVFNGLVWIHHEGLSYDTCLEIHGTDSSEVIIGSRGNDQIFGYGGRDFLLGYLGDDVFTGGSGFDRFYGGPGYDTVTDRSSYERCSSIEDGC